MTIFEIKCYPGTKSETVLTIRIGTMTEIAPNDRNYFAPDLVYGYDIEANPGHGIAHHGFKDRFDAQAAALLRAAQYGNGGFPLDSVYRRVR
jgi:hypothetical protein